MQDEMGSRTFGTILAVLPRRPLRSSGTGWALRPRRPRCLCNLHQIFDISIKPVYVVVKLFVFRSLHPLCPNKMMPEFVQILQDKKAPCHLPRT